MSASRTTATARLPSILVVCCLGVVAPGIRCASEEPQYLDEVATPHGPLGVARSPDGLSFEILLAGKRIAQEQDYSAVTIEAAHPSEESARLVLLRLATGGNACPEFYRIVEVRADGTAGVTDEFGNCSEFSKAEWEGTGFRIDIPAYEGDSFVHARAGGQSWVYRDGKLTRLEEANAER